LRGDKQVADDKKRETSFADSLGPDFQADSLKEVGSVREAFQTESDPTYADQVAAMAQSDKEKAQSGDGSKMISEEGSRRNMNPPEEMRKDVDAAVFEENIIADGLSEDFNKAKDDLYKEPKSSDFNRDDFIDSKVYGKEFDNKQENTSDYENDM
jgi:hypothetical protein